MGFFVGDYKKEFQIAVANEPICVQVTEFYCMGIPEYMSPVSHGLESVKPNNETIRNEYSIN